MARPSGIGDAFMYRRVVQSGQQALELSYRKRNDAPSLEYHLEGGTDVLGWVGGMGHFEEISTVPDALPGFTGITAWSIDSGMNDRFFVRLRLRRN